MFAHATVIWGKFPTISSKYTLTEVGLYVTAAAEII